VLVGDIGGTNARLSLWTSSPDGAHKGGRSRPAASPAGRQTACGRSRAPASARPAQPAAQATSRRDPPPAAAETYHQTCPTKDYDCFEALVKAFLQAAAAAAPGAAQPQSAAFACAGAGACWAERWPACARGALLQLDEARRTLLVAGCRLPAAPPAPLLRGPAQARAVPHGQHQAGSADQAQLA
jgi:hypothetical protein